MIFQAIEVSRSGGRKYPVYSIYADGTYIGAAISRSEESWIVPWTALDTLVGKRIFPSLRDAARHLYVASEKRPEEHRAWSVQMSMQFPDENFEHSGKLDSSDMLKMIGCIRRLERTRRFISLKEMSSISNLSQRRSEEVLRALVARGVLTPRFGNADYSINIRTGELAPKRQDGQVEAQRSAR